MIKRLFLNIFIPALLLIVGSAAVVAVEVRTVDIPMSDGLKLKADVYLPDGDGPFPVVLNRTPYNRKGVSGEAERLNPRGIAFVAVDVRGRFESEGDFVPFVNEGRDGVDTMKWILAQPWCNGKIAGNGGSYVGYTQWALTSEPVPGLAAIAPLFTTANIYEIPYRGGAFNLATALGWASAMHNRNMLDSAAYLMSTRAQKVLPLIKGDNKTGNQLDFYDDWLRHPDMDEFWERMNHGKHFDQKNVPALMAAGWFDLFLGSQLQDFVRMTTEGPPETAGKSRIIIGPWDHSGSLVPAMIKPPIIDLPDEAKKLSNFQHFLDEWYDYWLLGGDRPPPDLPPVRLFVMGSNLWMDFPSWPPPGMKPTPWYIHSAGSAASPEDGAYLSDTPPGDEPPDTYDYRPRKPTPSRGGAILGTDMGPYDYSKLEEERPDIL
ncbi:MAG: CocE/NonD family hydrolase, partial [bacterium]